MAVLDVALTWAWICPTCKNNSVPSRLRTTRSTDVMNFAKIHAAGPCGTVPSVYPLMFWSIIGRRWGDPWRL